MRRNEKEQREKLCAAITDLTFCWNAHQLKANGNFFSLTLLTMNPSQHKYISHFEMRCRCDYLDVDDNECNCGIVPPSISDHNEICSNFYALFY